MKRTGFCILVLALLLAAVPAALADSALVHAPDLMTFSDGQLRVTQTDASRDFLTGYVLEGDAGAVTQVMDEYVALLDGCGDVKPDSRFPLGSDRRIVAYTCDAEGVKRFNLGNSDAGWRIADVALCIQQTGSTSLSFYVAAGLRFQNNPDETQTDVKEDGAEGIEAAGEAAAAAAPSMDRELIVPAAAVEGVSFGPDSTAVQDPLNFVEGNLSVEGIVKETDYTYRSFKGSASSEEYILAYIDLLSSGAYNFTLKDSEVPGSHDGFYFAKYAFDYIGSAKGISTTKPPVGPDGDITLSYYIDGNRLRGSVEIGRGLSFEDLGLRRDGQTGDTSLPGESLQSALYRLGDGSYETEDGRFHAGVNEAVVYRDGTPYTVQASLTRNTAKNREELRIYNFYRQDSIVLTMPYDYPMTGDIYSGHQISPAINNTNQEKYIDQMEDFLDWGYSDQVLGVCHNGDYLFFFPDGGNGFEKAVVRIMNWDANRGEAVIYLCMTFDSEPREYEAMAVVAMASTPAGADADHVVTMAAGSTARIDFTGKEFNADSNVFTWEILEGSSLIEMTDSRSQSCTVYAIDPGQARIKVTYEYSVEGQNVLTGKKSTDFKSKSEEYVILIQ